MSGNSSLQSARHVGPNASVRSSNSCAPTSTTHALLSSSTVLANEEAGNSRSAGGLGGQCGLSAGAAAAAAAAATATAAQSCCANHMRTPLNSITASD